MHKQCFLFAILNLDVKDVYSSEADLSKAGIITNKPDLTRKYQTVRLNFNAVKFKTVLELDIFT